MFVAFQHLLTFLKKSVHLFALYLLLCVLQYDDPVFYEVLCVHVCVCSCECVCVAS